VKGAFSPFIQKGIFGQILFPLLQPRVYFEMNIITNFSFTLVSSRSEFDLVYASKMKTAICGYKGSCESIADKVNL